MNITMHSFCDSDFTVNISLSKDKYLLLYVESGKGKVSCNDKVYTAKNCCFILCKPEDRLSYRFPSGELSLYLVEFTIEDLHDSFPAFPLGINLCHNACEAEELLHRLSKEYNCKPPLWEIKTRAILWELLCTLSASISKEDAVTTVLNGLCMDIHESFICGEIDVKKYADKLGISRDRLSVLFRQRFGNPPYKYQLMLKMKTATFLLMNTDLPIGEISERLGFSSPLYFSSAYKKQMKITPTDMRKKRAASSISQSN